ncbi:MAG: hypothetical protein LBE35_01775 [Clostridiales bacterium]|jgi:hypothetical protein|nr:hypothetical protein [Clostridiales bacterium]
MTLEEIKESTREIHDSSMKYHLSNNVLAVNEFIQERMDEANRKHYEKSIGPQMEKLADVLLKGSDDEIKRVRKELEDMHSKRFYNVRVRYGDNIHDDFARINYYDSNREGSNDKVSFHHYLDIIIPIHLLRGESDNLRKLREQLGHELAHLVLHLEDVLVHKYRGYGQKWPENKEDEASEWANEILRLRRQRYEEICQSRVYEQW